MSNERVKVLRGKEILQDSPGFGVPAHIGREGDIFLDPLLPENGLRISDGVTPGGVLVGGGSSFTRADYTSSAGSTSDVIIDLTRKYQALQNLDGANYIMNDGTVEGQEIILVPNHHADPAQIKVEFANAVLYYAAQNRFNIGNFVVMPFSPDPTQPAITQTMRSMCRCVWILDHDGNGAWYLDGGARDFP